MTARPRRTTRKGPTIRRAAGLARPDGLVGLAHRLDRLLARRARAAPHVGLPAGGSCHNESDTTMSDHEHPTSPSAEMLRRFTYHAPTPEKIAAMSEIRDLALGLASAIERHCPPGRETANAVTQVEQASMWANAAIARPAAAAPRGLTMERPKTDR